MRVRKKAKESILKTLEEHPEGLTIQQIANFTKMSRITTTKYLHELLGEKRVYEKRIGAYRIFFIRERFLTPIEKVEIIKALKEKSTRRMR